MIRTDSGLALISETYVRRSQDPTKYAAEITCVELIRGFNAGPADPIEVTIDQIVLDRMGWRPGDAITLVPVPPERPGFEGKLIIRKASPGEIGMILDGPPDFSKPCSEVFLEGPHGPHFEWCFPAHWVENFFPGEYNEDLQGLDSETWLSWRLSDILSQTEQIELLLGPEKLFLYLQRTSPMPTTLDIHFPQGLLNLRGWSRSEPLVLESATDFDPFATEDALTVRENSLGEEPNLLPTLFGFTADVNPLWLNRFFPDHSDAAAEQEFDSSEPSSDIDPIDDGFAGAERDFLVVGYAEMASVGHSLSFEIRPPRPDRTG